VSDRLPASAMAVGRQSFRHRAGVRVSL